MEREGDFLKSRVRYDEPNDGTNVSRELLASFKRHTNRTLLVNAHGKREWTGGQLCDRVGRIATNLIREVGVKAGHVVLLMCDHSDHEILLALGFVVAGGAIYSGSPQDGYEETKVLCELVKPDAILANSNMHHMVSELKRTVAGLDSTRIFWIDNPMKQQSQADGVAYGGLIQDMTSNENVNNNNDENYYFDLIERDQVTLFDDLISGPLDEQLVEQVVQKGINAREQTLTYMLTSGSTGRPKIVPSTHEELVHGLYSMISSSKYPVDADGKVTTQDEEGDQIKRLLLPISEDTVMAGDLPLDHGAGLNTMFLSLIIGSKYIVMPSYEEDSFWQIVHDYRINSSISSTTFAYKLLCRLKSLIDSGDTNRWDLSCFKWLTCAGSKMAFTDLAREINQVYKNICICQCYGATEIGFISSLCIKDCRSHLHSVGHLFPGLKAKIIDRNTGRILGPNERGELHVWSRSKFKNYRCHKSDDANKLVSDCHDKQGFYKTGDQAHYDEEGRFYIHGRFKDTLYLMHDWKILPVELEDVVNQHPLVEVSAVVGVPDLEVPGCDAPRAFVKLISRESKDFKELESNKLKERLLADDGDFISQDIYRFVAERTAEPKHLKGGVKILAELPTVGLLNKIDRKALRQRQMD